VHELFEKGLKAMKKKEFASACEAFDRVLGENPMFDRRGEMVDAYIEFARGLPKGKLDSALLAAQRAERINQDIKREGPLESLRLTLEGERELARGVAEQVLFRRALELDASNQRARDALAMIERGESEPKRDLSRYYAAMAIGAAAVFAMLLIALWRPREKPVGSPADGPDPVTTDDVGHEETVEAGVPSAPGRAERQSAEAETGATDTKADNASTSDVAAEAVQPAAIATDNLEPEAESAPEVETNGAEGETEANGALVTTASKEAVAGDDGEPETEADDARADNASVQASTGSYDDAPGSASTHPDAVESDAARAHADLGDDAGEPDEKAPKSSS
jgi:hypothetical protein